MPSPTVTSAEVYWTDFNVTDDDLDLIFNLLLEREAPLTSLEMAASLIDRRLRMLEEAAKQAAEDDCHDYLPAEAYEAGKVLRFPALGNATGSVVGIRPGENPDHGSFDVILSLIHI